MTLITVPTSALNVKSGSKEARVHGMSNHDSITVATSALNVSTAQYNHNNMHNPTTTHITQNIKQKQHATHKHFTHMPHTTSEPVIIVIVVEKRKRVFTR